MAWVGDCSVVRFMDAFFVARAPHLGADGASQNRGVEEDLHPVAEASMGPVNCRGEVPEAFRSAEDADLASKMLMFIDVNFGDGWIPYGQAQTAFWRSIGVDRWSLEPELQLKAQRVEMLMMRVRESLREEAERRQVQEEAEEVPRLVMDCVLWAIRNGLNKLTRSDVDAFLLDTKREWLPQTRRAVYAKANVEMKTLPRH